VNREREQKLPFFLRKRKKRPSRHVSKKSIEEEIPNPSI
jgi:hypothetical protein